MADRGSRFRRALRPDRRPGRGDACGPAGAPPGGRRTFRGERARSRPRDARPAAHRAAPGVRRLLPAPRTGRPRPPRRGGRRLGRHRLARLRCAVRPGRGRGPHGRGRRARRAGSREPRPERLRAGDRRASGAPAGAPGGGRRRGQRGAAGDDPRPHHRAPPGPRVAPRRLHPPRRPRRADRRRCERPRVGRRGPLPRASRSSPTGATAASAPAVGDRLDPIDLDVATRLLSLVPGGRRLGGPCVAWSASTTTMAGPSSRRRPTRGSPSSASTAPRSGSADMIPEQVRLAAQPAGRPRGARSCGSSSRASARERSCRSRRRNRGGNGAAVGVRVG